VQEGVQRHPRRDPALRGAQREDGRPDADFEKILEEQAPLLDQIEAANAWELDSQIEQAMDALRLPPPDADVSVLSGGERRRVALCKLLLEAPDLLLLDEPTNHLDAESVLWLEKHLAQYAGAVLAVTHDRYFLDNVAQWILELDRGRAFPYEGNYSTYLEKKQERLAVQGKKDAKLAKRSRTSSSGSGRTPRAGRPRARAAWRATRRWPPRREEPQARLRGDPDPGRPRLGSVVIEADGLRKGFGDRVLIDGLSFTMPRGGIVGIIGPNGVGKTTLFKTIVGLEQADGGSVRVGETVKISYVDQNRSNLDPRRRSGRSSPTGSTTSRSGAGDAEPRLHRRLRLQGPGPAEEGRRAVRRGAQPPQPRAHAQGGRQRPAARRADQRPRHRDARLARERAARVPRLRRGHQPRPLVPRPRRHAHPGVGGRRGDPSSGTGSRATSSPTRRTRSSGSAPTPPVRTASPTASSPATEPRPQRWATAALVAVVLLSLYVLFTPRTGGDGLFPGSDKVVHLVLFALLAGTTRARFGPAVAGLAAVAAYAPLSELVQGLLLPTRSGDLWDVVADLLGVAAGWMLARRLA
jgi:ABC-type multidrug transport system ATPase subunit